MLNEQPAEYIKNSWWAVTERINAGILLSLLFSVLILGLFFAMAPLKVTAILVALPMLILSLLSFLLYLSYIFLLYEDVKKLKSDSVFTIKKNEKIIFLAKVVFEILVIVAVPVLIIQFSPTPISSVFSLLGGVDVSESKLDAYIDSQIFTTLLEAARNEPDFINLVKVAYKEKSGTDLTDEQIDATIKSPKFREVVKQTPMLREWAGAVLSGYIPALELLDGVALTLKNIVENSGSLEQETMLYVDPETFQETSVSLDEVQRIFALQSSQQIDEGGTAELNKLDKKRIDDLKEIQNKLEEYYVIKGQYPGGMSNEQKNWTNLKQILVNENIEVAGIKNPLFSWQDYGYYPSLDNQSYILWTWLWNRKNDILKNDIDGTISAGMPIGISCGDPFYCAGICRDLSYCAK